MSREHRERTREGLWGTPPDPRPRHHPERVIVTVTGACVTPRRCTACHAKFTPARAGDLVATLDDALARVAARGIADPHRTLGYIEAAARTVRAQLAGACRACAVTATNRPATGGPQ